MKDKGILKKLHKHFELLDFCTDYDNGLLFIHHSMCTICIEQKNELAVSFEVNCDVTTVAHIMKIVIVFSIVHNYMVEVYEPYAFVVSEDGEIKQVLHGDDAVYYHETGEYDIEEEPEDLSDNVDPEKQIDTILDQINTKGMKSLKKEQKQFLLNYSKGKNQHNH